MKTYIVSWYIDIEADSAEEAAQIALDIQRDTTSDAVVFVVTGPEGDEEIDLAG